jgi:hypothetical protein
MTLASSWVYLGMTSAVKKYGKVETSLFGTEAFTWLYIEVQVLHVFRGESGGVSIGVAW